MERLELSILGSHLVTTGHCLSALTETNDMTQALLGATRVGDVHDMHDDYPTLPAIMTPSETEPAHAYAFRSTLAGCMVYTCVSFNADGVVCGVYVPDDNTWEPYQLRHSPDEDIDEHEVSDDLFELTYSTLFDRVDLKHMDTIEIQRR